MSWWKKLFGSAPATPASEIRFPVVMKIIPGELAASVHAHTLISLQGEVPCWSYVSDGLHAQQHPEVVITIRREHDESQGAFPDGPLQLFALFHQAAGRGHRVGPGGITEFGDRRFLGHHLVYARALPLDGVPLPPSCLAALLVNDEELRAVRTFGLPRVLGRMGAAARYYPFPPWADRRRSGLVFGRAFEDSVLAKFPRRHVPNVHVAMARGCVTMFALRSERAVLQELVERLRSNQPFALLTDLDESADSCLVWEPGQQEPSAIAKPGSQGVRVGGCFLGFIPERPADETTLVEDGFVVELSGASSTALHRALAEGTELSIPGSEPGLQFALAWVDESYVSPIDGAVYEAKGGWRTYEAAGAASPLPQGAPGDGVRLLTAEASIAARCSVKDLVAFIQAIESCMRRTLSAGEGPKRIIARMTCTPAGHRVDLATQGDAPRAALTALHDALGALATPPVREGEVVFEVGLTAPPSA